MNGEVGDTIWGTNIPTSGAAAAGEVSIGIWVVFDVNVRITGFRAYAQASDKWFGLFQLWDTSSILIGEQAVTARVNNMPRATDGWRAVWLHPATDVAANNPVQIALHTGNPVFRNDGVLNAAPFVNGHATVMKKSDAPGGFNGVWDSGRVGSCFEFTLPLTDDGLGNMYAVDVFYRVRS